MDCPTCGSELAKSGLIVDLDSNTLICDGTAIQLTPIEAEILFTLNKISPKTKYYDELISSIYGMSEPTNALKTLHVFILKLRRKIAKTSYMIETVRCTGYRLIKRGGE